MSNRSRAVVVIVLGVAALLSVVLVIVRSGPQHVTVSQIIAKSGDFKGATVQVSGKVALGTPDVMGYRVFRLEDGGSGVWVLTKQIVPAAGTTVKVEGTVNKALPGIPSDYGVYLIETKRLSSGG